MIGLRGKLPLLTENMYSNSTFEPDFLLFTENSFSDTSAPNPIKLNAHLNNYKFKLDKCDPPKLENFSVIKQEINAPIKTLMMYPTVDIIECNFLYLYENSTAPAIVTYRCDNVTIESCSFQYLTSSVRSDYYGEAAFLTDHARNTIMSKCCISNCQGVKIGYLRYGVVSVFNQTSVFDSFGQRFFEFDCQDTTLKEVNASNNRATTHLILFNSVRTKTLISHILNCNFENINCLSSVFIYETNSGSDLLVSKTIFKDIPHNSPQLFSLSMESAPLYVSQCYFYQPKINISNYNESILKITDTIQEIKGSVLSFKLFNACEVKKGIHFGRRHILVISICAGILVLTPAVVYALYWRKRTKVFLERLDLDRTLTTDFG
ncbi:hypothetical protein TVAG_230620 [Trichomonas vaginalis G3]|uniref:Uncharacterized protein n=1 Tax=Trichomonas vaginalis (strain ATCC PRA-98 / G3) TaxID=412133 RepID=A2EDZ0_TRIV3|nr:pectin lyase-like family [Trichomonas vaginalis G3]EAY09102.1 hypothetical protein TVAG_230620 [Trichomonas vaginalis G3]KAI5502666.1 pectin lyase-like family [Trichomonas vaginalis G3]|eukprot:XP_001321325.1 hypothetical protein [Trichomonas vaginalis G3]